MPTMSHTSIEFGTYLRKCVSVQPVLPTPTPESRKERFQQVLIIFSCDAVPLSTLKGALLGHVEREEGKTNSDQCPKCPERSRYLHTSMWQIMGAFFFNFS